MSLHGYSDGEYDWGDDDNVTLISKLNVSHPLHLHPNNFVALTVVFVKLNGTKNYQVWSCAMLLAKEGKNKTGFIDGSCRRSNTNETLGRQWDRVSDVVLGWILNSISEEHFLSQIFSKRAKHVWDELKETYDKRSQTSTSLSRPSNNSRPNDNGNRRTAGGSTLVYENCGFNGYTIDRCFKIIGYPADFRKRKVGSNLKGKNVSNNVVGSNSSNGFSDEQMATHISLIKENFVNEKGVHSNMVDTYMNSSAVFNKNFEKFFCSNSSLHFKLFSKGLITDSGANQYITDKNLIDVIDISYLKTKVTHPNGTEAFITRIRNMPLTDYLTLYDVLVVHEYCVSLVSVHKVARDSKLMIAFDEMHCYAMNQDLRKGQILGTGKQIGGLYYFDGNQDVNNLNFFKTNTLDNLPKIPNDEERRNLSLIRHGNSPSHSSSTSTFSKENDAWHSQDVDASTSKNGSFVADEENNSNSEGNGLRDQSQDNVSQDNNGAQNLIRSFRTSVFPKFFNDFIVNSKVKYGLKKYVNYSYLSKGNYCFATMLNKGVEPKTYLKASQHKNWVDTMNAEMDALHRNNTWEIIDLCVGRKAIGSKWVWKIKYKSGGEIKRYKARCLINLVVQNGWSLFQLDINNAFLY
nr:ribonuclease H-like domain-containing protein [Tanacetum cinerariifolium]